jgi:hypothetical protein
MMQVDSLDALGNGLVDVVHSAVLAIQASGQAYGQTAGVAAESAVKQVDRLLSNGGLAPRFVVQDLGAVRSVVSFASREPWRDRTSRAVLARDPCLAGTR